MKYFKIKGSFEKGASITLELPGHDLITGRIDRGSIGYFLFADSVPNYRFITSFGVEEMNKCEFVLKAVGYPVETGYDFPEVKTLEDLQKVCEALEARWDGTSSTIHKSSHKHMVKLNFKI